MKSLASYGIYFPVIIISIKVSPSWIYCCLSNGYSLLILLHKLLIMRTRRKSLLLSEPISYSLLILLHNLSILRTRLLLIKLISYGLLILLHKLSISRTRRRRLLLPKPISTPRFIEATHWWCIWMNNYRLWISLWNRRSLVKGTNVHCCWFLRDC